MLLPAAVNAIVDKKWRDSLGERFGGGHWKDINQLSDQSLWFHAASVGELNGLYLLIEQLRDKSHKQIFVTTTSLTGKDQAIEKELASVCALLPFDHPFFIKRALRKLTPSCLIVTETEIWPNLVNYIHTKKIPICFINARVSDQSFPLYLKVKYLMKPIFSCFDLVLAQTNIDAERFIELGTSPDRVHVVGSTKFDRPLETFSQTELKYFADSVGIDLNADVFVAGSVREGEDAVVVDAFCKVRESFPNLQMIIAPRHPERFLEVAALLELRNISFSKRSEQSLNNKKPVLLLDTVGELAKVYALSTVAFVGGSLVNIGGHNPLEPAAYAKPVIMGPYTWTVKEAIASLINAKGAFIVQDEVELSKQLVALLRNREALAAAGDAAHSVYQKNLGATEQVLKLLYKFV